MVYFYPDTSVHFKHAGCVSIFHKASRIFLRRLYLGSGSNQMLNRIKSKRTLIGMKKILQTPVTSRVAWKSTEHWLSGAAVVAMAM